VDPAPSGLAEALRDHYTLERKLGRGGMATVYLAIDLKHKRPVALKVLHPELAQSLGPDRFRREIELAARLQHPHILSVHDSGETAGQLWFTMPYVEGESLRERLSRQKQLPIDDAIQITREAAQALVYAHQHGVIHRDIKPENILLTSDGSTLVADFGVARAMGQGDDRLTSAGIAVGTPAYMSPEQASGERELGPSTDVYSLGAVLYEMLVGEPPFTGPTPQAILARCLNGERPRVRTVRPAVPEELEGVVTRALAPVAADRFASAAEFTRALNAHAGSTGPSSTVTARQAVRSPRPLLFAVTVILVLTAIGVGFLWLRSNRPVSAGIAGSTRLAVLPFENLGRPEQDYFAEGMTDEVRGKLAGLPALSVVARTSSAQYKGTAKSPQVIARELGVQYLLTATVRWDQSGGANRVRVSPELIRASDASTTWQQPFEARMTDVFAVQSQIASRVAQALDVALGSKEKRMLSGRPTANLAAYDAFLKGEAAARVLNARFDMQRATEYYEQAVALDSTFAEAWARLARTRARMYSVAQYSDTAAVWQAAERAVALAPNRAETHFALGDAHLWMTRDIGRAFQSYQEALRLAPFDAELLTTSALSEQSLGRWEAALGHLDQARELDPRSVEVANQFALNLLRLRRYREALVAADRALALAPNDVVAIGNKVQVHLGEGDLAGARAILRAASSSVQSTELVASIASYGDLYWVLEDVQQRLLIRLPASVFGGERAIWATVRAEAYHLRGELPQSRVYADTARLELEAQLRSAPGDAQRLAILGLALAYLGQKREAIAAGERANYMLPFTKDAVLGAYIQHQLVRIYILTGEFEKALNRLEPLLRIPYDLSPGVLRIDPNFDPLRQHVRFQQLLTEGLHET
jgi:eukaryotic-like serine/threonine-protein kinase